MGSEMCIRDRYTGPPADVEQFLLALQQGFAIHDLGAAGTYTGIQIERTDSTVSLHSRDYIKISSLETRSIDQHTAFP